MKVLIDESPLSVFPNNVLLLQSFPLSYTSSFVACSVQVIFSILLHVLHFVSLQFSYVRFSRAWCMTLLHPHQYLYHYFLQIPVYFSSTLIVLSSIENTSFPVVFCAVFVDNCFRVAVYRWLS